MWLMRLPLALVDYMFIPSQFAIQGDTQKLGRRLKLFYFVVNYQRYGKFPFPLPSANRCYIDASASGKLVNVTSYWMHLEAVDILYIFINKDKLTALTHIRPWAF